MNPLQHGVIAAALAGLLLLGSAPSSPAQNLLVNGSFLSYSTFPTGGQVAKTGSGVQLTGWTNYGYTFIYPHGNAGDVASGGGITMRGPANGTANGLTTPPGGGNVLASDGAFQVGPLTQTITGMSPGRIYTVSFDWAGAQQNGNFNGATTDAWSVAMADSTIAETTIFTKNAGATAGTLLNGQDTTVVANVSHGFTGWMSASFNFTASTSSQTLYFLAKGTPTGVPPFALISDITVVPEASTWWTIVLGMGIMIGTRIWRRNPPSVGDDFGKD